MPDFVLDEGGLQGIKVYWNRHTWCAVHSLTGDMTETALNPDETFEAYVICKRGRL